MATNFGRPQSAPTSQLPIWRELIDGRLEQLTPVPTSDCEQLSLAWRHAASAPGKRIRGLLLLAVLDDLGQPALAGLDYACAVELTHTASLIIDDLPSMDDAKLRRGRATLHRKFGDSVAILTAIAMLSKAFALAAAGGNAATVTILARAIGTDGLVGGQLLDLLAPRTIASAIAEAYSLKTSALFEAACQMAATAAAADDIATEALTSFARSVGVAFQIADDALDGAETTIGSGKDVGIDPPGSTLASLVGLSEAQRWRDLSVRSATSNLSVLSESRSILAWLNLLFKPPALP